MKKIIFAILLASLALPTLAQETVLASNENENQLKKIYQNEIGIDATSFIKQFIPFNSQYYLYNYSYGYGYYTVPTYFLTYRRHLKTGNIRFAIGGSFNSHDVAPIIDTDIHQYKFINNTFSARLGWEFKTKLTPRWQVFYGIDLRGTNTHNRNDQGNVNNGYVYGSETKTHTISAAPLLGFRFRLNSRICISTETNYSFNFTQGTQQNITTPVSDQPPLAQKPEIKINEHSSSFELPLSVFFTFDI